MDSVLKGFVTVICMAMIGFTITGLSISSINASKADAFLSDCVRAVEEGNFQDSVISQCQTDAQKNNYELKCNKIDTNGDSYTDMVDMSLSYDYTIPFIHRDGEKHEIKAYAR